MAKDLTTSSIDRQNILNNPYALAEIEKADGIRGIPFEGNTVVLKEQVAEFFDVTPRTVENYVERHAEELARNGYELIDGKRLQALKLGILALDDPETDFGIKEKDRWEAARSNPRLADRQSRTGTGPWAQSEANSCE